MNIAHSPKKLSLVSMMLAILSAMPASALDIANSPLFLTPSVDPNIMFIIDDSGSMFFEVTPEDLSFPGSEYAGYVFPNADEVYGSSDYSKTFIQVATVDNNNAYTARTRSPQFNTTYYDPSKTYTPWIKHDNTFYPNASITCAWHNPENTGTCPSGSVNSKARKLTVNNGNYNDNRWRSCTSGGSCTSTTNDKTFWPATYYWHDSGDGWSWDHYTKVEIKTGTATYSGHGRENRTDCIAGVCTYAQEIQNFANWYTYYRSRILASRASIGIAFAQQGENLRVGYGAINKTSSSVDNVNTGTIVSGVRQFTSSGRETFFNNLYTRDIPALGTPLRKALNDAGVYFSRTDSRGPWSTTPGSSGGTDLECRHSYTILMTDGYWSGGSDHQAATSEARANVDNTSGPSISSPDGSSFQYTPADPFKDNYSNTLADIAMYYWNRDLRTNVDNLVPTSPQNEAFWQHMVTFGIGLGVSGSIDPDTAKEAAVNGTAISWLDPSPNGSVNCTGTVCPARLDDLLHASLNSRGGFFSTADPHTFATELNNVLNDIVGRTEGSSASVATNSTRLDTNTVVYQAKFDSRDWTGLFLAYTINPDGSLAESPSWDAGQKVTAQGAAGRSIFSYNPSATPYQGIEFFHNNLNASQQSLLSEAQVNYLRGVQSQEQQNGGAFRNRIGANRLLGDLVNSDPWFIGNIDFGYFLLAGTEGEDYLDYRNSNQYKNRTPLVAIGGNDGMLHVFNANVTGAGAGNEVFAYVPGALMPKLSSLTDPNYSHQYYVDGSPVAGDVYIDADDDNDKEWRTVLVGTLGAGGKGVFALDVTFLDPSDSSYATAENVFLPQRILWEINSEAAPVSTDLNDVLTGNNKRFGFSNHLGYTLGQASVVRMADGNFAAVFGNGYNSVNHQAVLYIVNIKTGALIKSLNTGVGSDVNPNGLSTPIAVDINGDRIVDAIYAGDLHGNLWKFDVSSDNPAQWDFAFKQGNTPKPLFVAMDSEGAPQPITAKPQAGKHPSSGVIIFFGTGKYFEIGDNSVADPQIQTFYGIRDECVKTAGSNENCGTNDPGIARADLMQQSIVAENAFEEFDIRLTSQCVDSQFEFDQANCNSLAMSNYLSSKQGWFMDLAFPADNATGERVIAQALLRGGRIIFVTLIPDPEPCGYGGTSWLMELDALTGNRLDETPFDLTGSGTIGEDDMVEGILDTNDDSITDESDSAVAASGKKSKVGIVKTPGVVGAGEVEYKYTSGSTGQMETTLESVEGGSGRLSWRQLR